MTRDNGLNALRLALAALVIAQHSFAFVDGSAPTLGDVYLGRFAVLGFFAISGYVIAASRDRATAGRFLVARVARIFPALWACLAVVAFGFAPLMSGWHLHDALGFIRSEMWLGQSNGTIGSTLHGQFRESWDISLWTLGHEFRCYLLLGALFAVPFMRGRAGTAATFSGAIVLAVGAHLGALDGHPYLVEFVGLFAAFAAGVALWAWLPGLPTDRRIAAACGFVGAVTMLAGWGVPLAVLPIAYVMLWVGATLPDPLRRVGQRNDISYGVYIYGHPVQHLLVAAGVAHLGVAAMFAVSLAFTVPLAWVSWRFVERPMIGVGRRLSARGLTPRARQDSGRVVVGVGSGVRQL